MKKDYTHISMVIDRSGSMQNDWTDVVGGYKQIVKDNKAAPGKCTFTVAAFDTEYDLVEDFTDIQEVDENLKVTPRGGTALLDAIGKTINAVGEKLRKMKEKDRPEKVIVMVQTDGEENASREFKKDDIKKLIDEQTETYKWKFMFIGASLESVNEATKWGFNVGSSSVYNSSNSGGTFTTLGMKMTGMRSMAANSVAYSTADNFTEDEKKAMLEEKTSSTTK